jgi:hypothetical protein
MRHDEARFVFVQPGGGVDEDFLPFDVHRRNGNLKADADQRVFDDFERCRQRAHERKAVDEPVLSASRRRHALACGTTEAFEAAREIDGTGDGLSQSGGETFRPVHFAPPAALFFRSEKHVRLSRSGGARIAPVFRNAVCAKKFVEPFLGACGKVRGNPHILGRPAQLQVAEETREETITRGIPLTGLRALAQVPEAEMQKAMRQHIAPFRWLPAPLRVDVEITVGRHHRPACGWTQISLLANHLRVREERPEQGVGAQRRARAHKVFRGRVRRSGALTLCRHRSSPRGAAGRAQFPP